MRFDILTLFPEMFHGVLNASILGRAAQAGHVAYHLHDIREYTTNKHRKVDERPFGGGPGMVMMCQPLWDAVHAVEAMEDQAPKRILLTPQGRPLDQQTVEELSGEPRLLLIAGHYEGIDERVVEALDPMEISVGDYVLSGGELPAMILIDAVTRLLPGVLGHEDSAAEDSFAERSIGVEDTTNSGATRSRRLLDCPHYTRPRTWNGQEVPEVLLNGDHAAIDQWREEQMVRRTKERRPDLLNP